MINGELKNITAVSGNLRFPDTGQNKLVFKNYFEFPPLGDEKKLYIATDENAIYRFDKDVLVYVCIGRETKLNTIQCVINKED